jgi:cobalamin-dependent methionine synthase I
MILKLKKIRNNAKSHAESDGLSDLLAVKFAEYWHKKWPFATTDVKKLELSAHYRGCRDAFYAGYDAHHG